MSDPAASPFAVLPGMGTTIQGPAGGPLTFKVRGDQSGGMLTAFENVIAPGDGPPLERFFDRFAALPESADAAAAFGSIGREVGMEVVGPPLSRSHPQ